jgi:hypothetical protein
MPLPTIRGQQAHLGRAVLLSVFAIFAVIALVAAIFFRSDPQASDTLQYIRTDQQRQQEQQQRMSGQQAITDRSAAEKFLAQTRGTKGNRQ